MSDATLSRSGASADRSLPASVVTAAVLLGLAAAAVGGYGALSLFGPRTPYAWTVYDNGLMQKPALAAESGVKAVFFAALMGLFVLSARSVVRARGFGFARLVAGTGVVTLPLLPLVPLLLPDNSSWVATSWAMVAKAGLAIAGALLLFAALVALAAPTAIAYLVPDVRQFPDVERERPAPVTTAAGLLVLASVCVAVGGVATFIFVRATVLPEDFDDRRIDAFGAYWTVLVVLTGVIALVAAAVAAPVRPLLRGVAQARSSAMLIAVATCVVGGLGVLAASHRGRLGDALAGADVGSGAAGWAFDAQQLCEVGAVVSLFLAMVVLVLPRTREYFRVQEAELWARPVETTPPR